MKNIIPLLSFLTLLFAQNEIEGRWHLVGYEDAVMYEFVDTEPFADAGLRYSIYADENGEFDDLDGDNIGGTPHPYSVAEDIITIDTHFGNILSYQMNFRCDGQVVEFIDIDYNAIHSTLFKEGFDYFNSDCEQVLEECFDFTNNDFGACTMVLGVGLLNDECSYISGCDWTIDGIDYSDLFFDSIEECQEICSGNNDCFITSDDILGPYYFEDAPFRSVIAHADEPGQRLFISGNVMQNDCGNSISGSLIEIWQANDEGCYGIVEDCDTGNPENDYFNLRGKFFSDENGDYTLAENSPLISLLYQENIQVGTTSTVGCGPINPYPVINLIENQEIFEDEQVPDMLLSGNHSRISEWKANKSLIQTYLRRPELINKVKLTKKQKKLLEELESKDIL